MRETKFVAMATLTQLVMKLQAATSSPHSRGKPAGAIQHERGGPGSPSDKGPGPSQAAAQRTAHEMVDSHSVSRKGKAQAAFSAGLL